MALFIASDHAGFEAKERLKLSLGNYHFTDLGTDGSNSVDFPLFATRLVHKVLETNGQGILLCGSGIGVSMAANRYSGIRAARICSVEDARLAKEHNNTNVLCMGSRLCQPKEMASMVKAWIDAVFEGGRHAKRIEMFNAKGEKPC